MFGMTIDNAILLFPCSSHNDNLKSSRNFVNLSIIRNSELRVIIFCTYVCPRPEGSPPLREGDGGGKAVLRSKFSNLLSALSRVFQIFRPLYGPIFKFLSILGHIFFFHFSALGVSCLLKGAKNEM